jgi:hypothetical protein
VKNIPFARKKAERYFNDAIKLSREIGAKGFLGQALLNLGLLYKAKKRSDSAKKIHSGDHRSLPTMRGANLR